MWKSGVEEWACNRARGERQEARGDRVKFKIVRAQKFGVLLLYLRVFGVLGRVMLSFSGVKSVPNSARVSV